MLIPISSLSSAQVNFILRISNALVQVLNHTRQGCLEESAVLRDIGVKQLCLLELSLFNLLAVSLLKATCLQIYQVRLKGLLIVLNLIVALLESLNQVAKVGHGHLEVLAVVTLVVRQIVNLVGLLQKDWHFPGAVVTDEVLHHGASAVPMHIGQVGWHHLVYNSHAEVSRQQRCRNVQIIHVRT